MTWLRDQDTLKALKFIDALKGVKLQEGPRQGKESLNVVAMEGVAKRFGDIPNACKVGLEIRVVAPYSTERMRGEIENDQQPTSNPLKLHH